MLRDENDENQPVRDKVTKCQWAGPESPRFAWPMPLGVRQRDSGAETAGCLRAPSRRPLHNSPIPRQPTRGLSSEGPASPTAKTSPPPAGHSPRNPNRKSFSAPGRAASRSFRGIVVQGNAGVIDKSHVVRYRRRRRDDDARCTSISSNSESLFLQHQFGAGDDLLQAAVVLVVAGLRPARWP